MTATTDQTRGAVPSVEEGEQVEVANEQRERTSGRKRAAYAVVALLAVAAMVTGVVLGQRARALRGEESARNIALVDSALTTEVTGAVSLGLGRVFTYSYLQPQITQAASRQVLTGEAATQYATLFEALTKQQADQKLTMTAKATVAGVKRLTSDRAELLVFLDQSSTRASDKKRSVAAAQLAVSATRENGVWKVSHLRPL